MDDDARRVQDAAQARPDARLQLGRRPRDEVAGGKARLDVLAGPGEGRAGRVDDEGSPVPLDERGELVSPDQLVHGGKLAKRIRRHGRPMIVTAFLANLRCS